MGDITKVSIAEARRQLRAAIRQTSIVGSEVYYPARWRFGDKAGNASTSTPLCRHNRTESQARVMVAADHVARELGAMGLYLEPEDATVERAARKLAVANG